MYKYEEMLDGAVQISYSLETSCLDTGFHTRISMVQLAGLTAYLWEGFIISQYLPVRGRLVWMYTVSGRPTLSADFIASISKNLTNDWLNLGTEASRKCCLSVKGVNVDIDSLKCFLLMDHDAASLC